MEGITVSSGEAGEGELPINPGPVRVKVCPVKDPHLGLIFAMGGEVDGTAGSVKGYVIRLKKNTERIIEFYLDNVCGTSLEFHDVEPIWITDKDECPETSSWVGGFSWKRQAKDHLRLKNPGDQGVFTFTLRFVDGNDPTRTYICDPIIKNIA